MRRSPRARDSRIGPRGRQATMVLVAGLLCMATALPVAAQEGPPDDWRPEEHARDASVLETGKAEQPADVPKEDRQASVHEVRRGDTLWHLAGRYLVDPFRWPEIHRLNTNVVADPHWIYPGDRLTLPPDAARVAGLGTGASARPAPGEAGPQRREAGSAASATGSPARTARSTERGVSRFGGSSVFDQSPRSADRLGVLEIEGADPSPLVSRSDFHRSAYLAEPASLGPLATTVRKLEGNPLGLTLPTGVKQNDRVVLALNGLEARPEDVLQAVRFGRGVEGHGQVVHSLALLRVTETVGDSARAVVTRVFGNYRVGDPVLIAERFADDVPATRHRPSETLVTTLIGVEREQALLGRGTFVFLDVGETAGVALGDEFAIFQPGEPNAAAARWEDRQAIARVIRLRPGSATAMIVDLKDVGASAGAPARLAFRAGQGP